MDCVCNSERLWVVFDLDGVLVDTKALVERAYAEVGVTMPPGAWGQPWTGWLPAALDGTGRPVEDVRRDKARVYQRLLRSEALELLSPWEVWCRLDEECTDKRILTGASLAAVRALIKHVGAGIADVIGWELRTETRATLLNSLARPKRRVVYIDDLPDAVAPLLRPEIHVIRYTGQTADQLWEQLWTPSSSPRVATRA